MCRYLGGEQDVGLAISDMDLYVTSTVIRVRLGVRPSAENDEILRVL